MSLFKLIVSDYKKHKKYGSNFFVILFFTQGFWATFQYRIANFVYINIKLPILRHIILFVLLLWKKTIEICTGISIAASVKIGHSFYIGHFGGIIINSNVEIGDNCNISQGVTIGISGIDDKRGTPVLGNNVYIGANAVIAGKISIGNNVLVGACSMVKSSFLDNSVVLGVPAILISEKGSKGYI
ncbi:serine acetyltransferase [Flavobacterium sp. GA093]|uniref:Serine acetyltransferase n=1 Tax=Flavobacterium hydrocarbonoxydans TaxID=2683249 RepID=A0A6I4NJF7_9FLAO|nr:serine acetyltransferase [Flavobacterium hydrocarbonoxydans]MWB94528.1 serine acetyltransferase [Flavobacterium hydrocarbonoxydans]